MIADKTGPLKIGSLTLSNALILAPLSGISNLPFRLLAKEQGCALVCTEMISAEGLLRNRRASEKLLRSCPEERPLAVQIFGSKPDVMAEAARIVESLGADVLDINMGCPVRKVVKSGSGAALLKDVNRVAEILRSVRKAVSIPLTLKIRSGWDEKSLNFLEIGRVAEDCGVDALTVHGRTRTQGYGVKADWEVVARTKKSIRIPVIGSGDLTSPEAIRHFFVRTGADGAMIGRGSLGNPWIFRQTLLALRGLSPGEPSLEEKETDDPAPPGNDAGTPGRDSRGAGVSEAPHLVHPGTSGKLGFPLSDPPLEGFAGNEDENPGFFSESEELSSFFLTFFFFALTFFAT